MPAKKIKPLGNKIVIERKEAMASKGGILLPENAKQKPHRGTVVAVGPGKWSEKGKLDPLHIKVGDEVLFSSYAGTEYKADDKEYLILSEEDIFAVVL